MKDDVGTLIEPASVVFTWGAPGWYVAGVLFLLVLTAIAWLIFRHWKKNSYRREALSWLAAREEQLRTTKPELLVYDATMLLKRIVMTRYGRTHASADDKRWITFLNSACHTPMFTDVDAGWLARTLYVPGKALADGEVQDYLGKTRKWIKQHRHAL